MKTPCDRCTDLEKEIKVLKGRLLTWDEEIATAAELQKSLLPETLPEMPSIDFAAECHQAIGIGGDFYDCWQLSHSRIALLIGDVSGHGLPAALMAAQLRMVLRRELLSDRADLGAKITSLNEIIFEASPTRRFVTLFYGELDLDRLSLRYVNAGHPPPMLARRYGGNQQVNLLTEGGLPLGMFRRPPVPFGFGECNFIPGDILVAFSDGLTEAQNPQGIAFGMEGVEASLKTKGKNELATALLTGLLQDVVGFCDGQVIEDDVTLLVFRVRTN